jgi:radical SAM protein with 4Fe4S-binding SPASM domain
LLPANLHELQEFEDWAIKLPWMDKRPAYSMFFDLRARRDRPEKQKQITRLRNSATAALKTLQQDKSIYLAEMRTLCSPFTGKPKNRLFTCGAGTGCSVDAYGWYQPCLLLRHPDTVWNSRQHRLIRVLKEFFPKMRELRAFNPDYLNRCSRCSIKGMCEQCPAKSWMESGTLDTPVEYLCQLTHDQALAAGLLSGNEKGWHNRENL